MSKQITIQQLVDEWFNRFPNFYEDSINSINYKFSYSILENMLKFINNSEEYDSSDAIINGLKATIFVSTATGDYLDQLGELFKLTRRDNETDSDFRARIIAYWPGFSGGGTIDSLKDTLSKMTGIDYDDINVVEDISYTNDTFVYSTIISEYYLTNSNIIKDSETLEGIVGGNPYEFIKNVDYYISYRDGKITFGIGGTNPDNTTNVTAKYEYQDNMKLVITANVGLTDTGADTIETIKELVPQIKAAGIYVLTSLGSQFVDDIGTLSESYNISENNYIYANWHKAGDKKLT